MYLMNHLEKVNPNWSPYTIVPFSDYEPRSICEHLQYLFALLQNSNRRYIDPSGLVKALGLDTGQQQVEPNYLFTCTGKSVWRVHNVWKKLICFDSGYRRKTNNTILKLKLCFYFTLSFSRPVFFPFTFRTLKSFPSSSSRYWRTPYPNRRTQTCIMSSSSSSVARCLTSLCKPGLHSPINFNQT